MPNLIQLARRADLPVHCLDPWAKNLEKLSNLPAGQFSIGDFSKTPEFCWSGKNKNEVVIFFDYASFWDSATDLIDPTQMTAAFSIKACERFRDWPLYNPGFFCGSCFKYCITGRDCNGPNCDCLSGHCKRYPESALCWDCSSVNRTCIWCNTLQRCCCTELTSDVALLRGRNDPQTIIDSSNEWFDPPRTI
jgi:hypothetical protein